MNAEQEFLQAKEELLKAIDAKFDKMNDNLEAIAEGMKTVLELLQ